MRRIKIPQQDFALKMPGGSYARGGAYLRDTTVHKKHNHVFRLHILSRHESNAMINSASRTLGRILATNCRPG